MYIKRVRLENIRCFEELEITQSGKKCHNRCEIFEQVVDD